MGANLDYRIYGGSLSTKDIADRWSVDVEQSLMENGNSYSGSIGMLGHRIASWHDLSFKTEAEAIDWLSDNQDKWDPAIAVSFLKIKRNPVSEQKYKDALNKEQDKLKLSAEKHFNLLLSSRDHLLKGTKKFCICSKCHSRLNISFLRANIPDTTILCQPYYRKDSYPGVVCPLCKTGLYTKKQYERIDKDYERLAKDVVAVKNFTVEDRNDTYEKYWIVGGWCSS